MFNNDFICRHHVWNLCTETTTENETEGNCEEDCENLSVTCWLTVGRLSVTCRSTDGRQLTDSRPTGFLGSSSSQLPNRECDLFNDTQYHLSRSSNLLFLFYHDGDILLLNDTVPLCAAPFLQMPGCLENSKLALFYPKLRGLPKSFAWLTGWLFFQMTAIFISYAICLLFHLIFCHTLFYLFDDGWFFFLVLDTNGKKPLWGGSFPCEELTKITSIFPDLIFWGYPFISYL